MIRALAVASVATYCGLGLPVVAVGDDQKATFESLDKNSDGKVSINEAAADDRLFVAFKSLDRDKDGELTREEFARYEGAKSGA
jgi:Ca2+-binding EF-hand superfamily protein